MRKFIIVASILAFGSVTAEAQSVPVVKDFPLPPVTGWEPVGCRNVGTEDPAIPSRIGWRALHSDVVNSDEMSRALLPAFREGWTAESDRFMTSGPVFDSQGNLYMAPFRPYDDVAIISLDPDDGSRRWAVSVTTPAPVGGGTPMVLADPADPAREILYLGLYDRVLAVETDGTLIYDQPSGLTAVAGPDEIMFSVNYHPQNDALVGLTGDGFVYAVDRTTGVQILNAPFELPGEISPVGAPPVLPPAVLDDIEVIFRSFVNLPPSLTFSDFVTRLLGNEIEAANFFSIDPATGSIWMASTAPDAEDGTVDGVSEKGGLYRLELVPSGGKFDVVENCHISFDGGTASTPALRQDGTRVYLGDNSGKLIAIDTDCNEVWNVDVGAQIVGSVEVSYDNAELYVSTLTSIIQVIDNGASGTIGWTAALDVFDPPPGQSNFNLLLAGIGATGVTFHAGSGIVLAGTPLPARVGVGVLDRETGAVRYFAEGPEESVAAMNTSPDGGVYIGNSPFRRIITRVLFPATTGPIVGGITKFEGRDLDLLLRDAACAAERRGTNAAANLLVCPASVAADGGTMRELATQMREAAPRAIAGGDLSAARWSAVDAVLTLAEADLDDYLDEGMDAGLAASAGKFATICASLQPCPVVPEAGCRSAGSAKLRIQQRGGARDKFAWQWDKGELTDPSEFGDPTTSTETSICIYTGASPTLVADLTVPGASAGWGATTRGFRFKGKKGAVENGVKSVVLKGEAAGRSKISVRGKGLSLPDPTLPIAELPVLIQMVNNDSGVCFETSFSADDVSKNEADALKAAATQ